MNKVWILLGLVLVVVLAFGVMACCGKTQGITVSIDAPKSVNAGREFTARLSIEKVKDLKSYGLDLSYDPAVIQVVGEEAGNQGMTPGVVDTTSIPIDSWGFAPVGKQGTVRVLGQIPGVGGAAGSGYLAEIHFRVVGSAGMKSDITLSNGRSVDVWGKEMANVKWLASSVTVVGTAPTPTVTPTATPTSTPTATPTMTPVPTATPPWATPPPADPQSRGALRLFGNVTVNGLPAGNGTVIKAIIKGYVYTTTTPSQYAVYGPYSYDLMIAKPMGLSYEGETISFMIGNLTADQKGVTWKEGTIKPLNLTATNP